jgi:hypothetical protein
MRVSPSADANTLATSFVSLLVARFPVSTDLDGMELTESAPRSTVLKRRDANDVVGVATTFNAPCCRAEARALFRKGRQYRSTWLAMYVKSPT